MIVKYLLEYFWYCLDLIFMFICIEFRCKMKDFILYFVPITIDFE